MSELELHKELRIAWEQTPLIVKIPNDDFKILYQENRYMILRALNKGIHESELDYTRHILTAHEILDYVQNNHKEDTKLTNIYFHLQKLQEKGMIKEVTQIQTGKRPKTYYGRTAKIFLNTEDMGYDVEDEFIKKLIIIIKTLQPQLDESEIKQYFQDLNEFAWENEEIILGKWFSTHKELLDKVDIDSARLYLFLAKLLDFDTVYKDYNNRLVDLLLLNDN